MPRIDLGGNWTPLVRNVLVALFVIYVVQLLVGGPFTDLFAWQPFGPDFRPWQVLTAFLLGTEPIGTVFSWLFLFFVLPMLDGILGRRSLGLASAFAWFFAVASTFVGLALGLPDPLFMGPAPILVAYTALVGFLIPEATFLLFFVLPVKAKYLGWGSGLIAFLFAIAAPSTTTSLSFFAWVGAWLWAGWHNGAFRRMKLQADRKRVERKLAKLQVIEGGKARPEDWVN